MAYTKQQRKRIRQDAKQYAANAARRSRVKTMIKGFEASLATAGSNVAEAFRSVMSEIGKASQRGILTKGAAARKTSRLAARITKAQAAPAAVVVAKAVKVKATPKAAKPAKA